MDRKKITGENSSRKRGNKGKANKTKKLLRKKKKKRVERRNEHNVGKEQGGQTYSPEGGEKTEPTMRQPNGETFKKKNP